jgi:acetoacetyl-CoA synthetase
MSDVIWEPSNQLAAEAGVSRYLGWLERERGLRFNGYEALWQWSVDYLDAFWCSVWDFEQVIGSGEPKLALAVEQMPGAVWFPDVAVNYAENLFHHATDSQPALLWLTESAPAREISWGELRRQAGALAATLRELGVERGDRIAGYVSNRPEAVVALIACASIGAIWSVCAPEYGSTGVISRFGQLHPKILVAVDGYTFGGREFSRKDEVREISTALETVTAVIWVNALDEGTAPPGDLPVVTWSDAIANDSELDFERLPFDHPLWVLFSSGTTGAPKGIVHGHGGIVLEQLKMLRLQCDVRAGDRVLYVATPSWVIWNLGVSSLLVGATCVLLDESPTSPNLDRIWRQTAEHGVTMVGVGAAYIDTCMTNGIVPNIEYDLSSLRELVVTGSPLASSGFEWVRDKLGEHVWLASTSGGTDVCTAFVGGTPLRPVRSGRIQAKYLGVKVEAWDESGSPVIGQPGELIVTRPMPSMPLFFWDDDTGARLHSSYFEMFPGVWRHGDFIEFDTDGSSVIHGRSDSTLNRKGVRIGSMEIYEVVERIPGVKEALVIGAELETGYYMPLFIAFDPGVDERAVTAQVKDLIRTSLSPRHIPDEIIAVPGIPHTKTGKKLELPIKRIIQGVSVEAAVDLGAIDHPDAIRFFGEFARDRIERIAMTGQHE